jgi:hypothetical protein
LAFERPPLTFELLLGFPGTKAHPENPTITIRNLEERTFRIDLTTNELLNLSINVTEKILTLDSREE